MPTAARDFHGPATGILKSHFEEPGFIVSKDVGGGQGTLVHNEAMTQFSAAPPRGITGRCNRPASPAADRPIR